MNEIYLDLINPIYMRTLFKTNEEFKEWLIQGSLEDLNCTMRVFIDAELYEDCAIVRDVIKKKPP